MANIRYRNKHYCYDVARYKEVAESIKRRNPEMGNVEVSFVVDNRLASLKWAFINAGIYYWEPIDYKTIGNYQGVINFSAIREFFVDDLPDFPEFVNFRIGFLDEGNNLKYMEFSCVQSYKTITADRLTTIINYQNSLR